MPAPHSVALLGFSPFERNTLGSYFRLATHRSPSYALVQTLSEPDFMVADADHAPSVQLALAEDMLERTVFIGARAPEGATAWMQRPIDPLHVMRELDAMVALHTAALASGAGTPTGQDNPPADLNGDDQPTVIRPRPQPADTARAREAARPSAPPAPPAPPSPPVHGQRTVTLPRRSRRATIETAFEGDGSSLPKAPALPDVLADTPAAVTTTTATATATATADSAEVDITTAPTLALPTRPRPSGVPLPPPPPRALLVDDSELARHFLSRLLEPWGVVCDQAPASQHALQCLAQGDYDFIFLDLELGAESELDGLSLCQHIKRLHSNVQAALATVVMVSAHHSETDRVRGTLAGCDAYLGKPLKQDELQQLLLRLGLKPPAGTPARPQASRPA